MTPLPLDRLSVSSKLPSNVKREGVTRGTEFAARPSVKQRTFVHTSMVCARTSRDLTSSSNSQQRRSVGYIGERITCPLCALLRATRTAYEPCVCVMYVARVSPHCCVPTCLCGCVLREPTAPKVSFVSPSQHFFLGGEWSNVTERSKRSRRQDRWLLLARRCFDGLPEK